ncbi:glycosyltransferase family 2 protein [Pseudoalteromonas sp. KAN5]|uniref:glycosyltransferase family 2 protein n=1 Tax=Pseudoalteromonas sp. KAN5 TaxID=2916633 RepID=UPI001FCAE354|nr:glycosyltransferase family 2 protein [Pseudoalteromonas sp. KAN5]BDF95559.1 glycosyl transferase [Pseudoalteromonas sp. KAN5]
MNKIGSDLVSIIMPAYNVAGFIAESIESVIKQKMQSWELIIVDDCSTDQTVSVIRNFLVDKRIKLIQNNSNLGGAGSRNVAIEHAQGRYVAFLDSDDLWTTDKLEKQINFMQKNNFGFSFSGYSTIDEQGMLQERLSVPEKVNFKKLLKHNYIGCLTAIYDTQVFGKIYMPLVRKRQDFALWLELLKQFDYAYGLQDNLGFYRIRTGSLSRSKSDAFKYYWRVLRDVGNCGYLSASYNLSCYLFIVFLKKKAYRSLS